MIKIEVRIEGPAYMRPGHAIKIAKEAILELGFRVGDFEQDIELDRCLVVGDLEVDPKAIKLLEIGISKNNVTITKQ